MAGSDERNHDPAYPLLAISNELSGIMKKYYGKGPSSTKTYMIDDLVFVVMRDGLTPAEMFLLDHDEPEVVRSYRQTFQDNMDRILSEKVEELVGRKVRTYQSQILFDPDILIEVFVLDRAPKEAVEATARGLLEGEPVGEVLGEPPADAPT